LHQRYSFLNHRKTEAKDVPAAIGMAVRFRGAAVGERGPTAAKSNGSILCVLRVTRPGERSIWN
jgi:hypothetical protein